MNSYFSVATKGSDQVEAAVASYVFNIISLGEKLPIDNWSVKYLISKAEQAFYEVLNGSKVNIEIAANSQDIIVSIE